MPKDAEWHDLNDRVRRLEERVGALEGKASVAGHPAVLQDAASETVVLAYAPELQVIPTEVPVSAPPVARTGGAMVAAQVEPVPSGVAAGVRTSTADRGALPEGSTKGDAAKGHAGGRLR
jgi:hypothetical protein